MPAMIIPPLPSATPKAFHAVATRRRMQACSTLPGITAADRLPRPHLPAHSTAHRSAKH